VKIKVAIGVVLVATAALYLKAEASNIVKQVFDEMYAYMDVPLEKCV